MLLQFKKFLPRKLMILIIFIPFITKTEEILNKNYFTLKTAELNFLSHYLKDLRISKGLYFGVEGAFKILKRTYIAVETGFGNSKDRGIWKKDFKKFCKIGKI